MDSVVDDVVLFSDLLLESLCHVHETFFHAAHVDIAETLVEENLCGIKFELETKLFVIDGRVSTKVEKGIIEVFEGKIIASEKEVGYTSLEISMRDEEVRMDE